MTKLLYIFILIGAAAFYLLFADSLSFILLISLLILPVILLVQLIIGALFLRCSTVNRQISAFRGEPCDIAFRITNDSVFPLPNTRLRIKAVCYPMNTVKYMTVNIPLPALRTETVTLSFGAEHCCRADITVENVKIYDLLRLFSARLFKNKLNCSLFIIPKPGEQYADEARELLSRPHSLLHDDTEASTEHGSGVPGDVCGFREFLPGDRLSLMHYKLSARFDKDIVKILSSDGAPKFLLTADLSSEDPDCRDRALERLMSVAYFLCREKAEVFAAVSEDGDVFGLPVLSGTEADGFNAVKLSESADLFAAAKVLCCADSPAAQCRQGFICCDLSERKQ